MHIANPSLYGHSTADTAGWDASAPHFFSGTACTAKGVAVAQTGNVAHAQLCIGENGSDTVVNEYFDGSASGGTSAASVPLNAMFDSTHFKDGTKIKLTLKVWDTNGGHYEIEVEGPAYNKGIALLNNTSVGGEDAFGVERVRTALQLMHHTVPSDDGVPSGSYERYHRDDIYQALATNSVFYILTHADVDNFGDCYCPYEGISLDNGCFAAIDNPSSTDSTGKNMHNVDITHAVLAKNNQPPFNFVFVDGCETAGTTGSSISYNLADAFGIDGQDRAFLGWHNEIFGSSSENIEWKVKLWDSLKDGDTIWVAVEKATIDGDPIGEEVRGDPSSTSAIFPVILGDKATKLHSVYSGKNTDWYRPL